jgi:hypothetical protein
MSQNKNSIALNAIKASYNNESGEYGINLFVSHHLEQFDKTVWKKILGKSDPTPQDVIDAIVFIECEDDVYDFSLPNEVTDYVICVSFDDSGAIDNIAMES